MRWSNRTNEVTRSELPERNEQRFWPTATPTIYRLNLQYYICTNSSSLCSFFCASLLFSCMSFLLSWLVTRFHFLFSFLPLYLFYMFIYGRMLFWFSHCRRQRRTCREMYLGCVIMFAVLCYSQMRCMFVYMLLSLFTFDDTKMKFHAFLLFKSLLLFNNELRAVEQIGRSVSASWRINVSNDYTKATLFGDKKLAPIKMPASCRILQIMFIQIRKYICVWDFQRRILFGDFICFIFYETFAQHFST